jgi:hypothetical protein
MNEDNRGKINYMREYARYSSLIFQMFVIVAAGVLGGIELDRLLNTKSKVFTITLTLLSSFLAIYILFKTLFKK